MSIISQRMTGKVDGDFVVFMIGMRVNAWWKPWTWLRTGAAMRRMLIELGEHPEMGFMGAESWFGRTTIMVQYWRSMDALMQYAKNRQAEHLPAWRAFNKMIGASGDVGIWHETYRVRAGDYENIYVNMMPFGVGKVGALTEVSAANRAADRLAAPAAVAV